MIEEDLSYEDIPEHYHQAVMDLGYGGVLRRYWESENGIDSVVNLVEEFEPVYENPLELLDPEERRKVEEMAKTRAILDGETGDLAGMDYLHTGAASD